MIVEGCRAVRPTPLIVESGAHWPEGCRCVRGELEVGATASKWDVLGNVTCFYLDLPESGSEVACKAKIME